MIYLCDPDKNTKCRSDECFLHGGACYCTTDPSCARLDHDGNPVPGEDDRLYEAIDKVLEEYSRAVKNKTVRTPVAYALYHAWRWADSRKEKTS